MGAKADKQEILNVAKFLDMGFYRVKESGEFLEADQKARDLFGIPRDETDLSKYSIQDFYIFPAERKLRIDRIKKSGCTPVSAALSLRVQGEYRLFFDQSWCEKIPGGEICIAGLVKKVEGRVISPEMFDEFPLGLYLLDEEKKIVNFNKKALEIFGYNTRDKENLLGENIADFYENLEEREKFAKKMNTDGHAHDVLRFKNVQNKIIELECFTEHHNEFKKASWGIFHDVTKRQRYFRALDKMPTGYYYIKHDEKGKNVHDGYIVQCNDQYAKILGVEKKEDVIGKKATKFYASLEEGEEFFKALEKADEAGKAIQNYHFRIRRPDNGEIVHIETDCHLVREHGKVVGREGTIRDISEKVELEEMLKEREERLHKMTADINNLIHAFLHPVLKFSGQSELFSKLGHILFESIRHKASLETDLRELGKELKNKLLEIKKKIENISETTKSGRVLNPIFEKIINVFDYNLSQAEESKILLDKAIRDVALWLLEELEQIHHLNENVEVEAFKNVITDEFVEYLQDILFDYLIRTAGILNSETRLMKRGVEALRRYIAVGEKKHYSFKPSNLGKILEANIELFKPILAQKDIGIEYQHTGDLKAVISDPDIDRVICNLFHNASKYSYKGLRRFLRITARELRREDAVEFHIKSCGVPIKQHEIDSGDIFKFGYRSKLVYQTDRDGTGVGLADAKEVIDAHGGEITITSKPLRDDGDPPQYKVPYITTVIVKLPKSKKRRN